MKSSYNVDEFAQSWNNPDWTLEERREAIQWGHKEKGFQPEGFSFWDEVSHFRTVLDFGCGMGRNLPDLRRYFDEVWGFDLPNMVRHAPIDLYDAVGSSHILVDRMEYDCVFASLVFQHIEAKTLARYLRNLKTKTLAVVSREWMDDGRQDVLAALQLSGWKYTNKVKVNEDHWHGVFTRNNTNA